MINLHFTALGLQAVAVLMGAIFTTAFRVKNERFEVNLKQLKSAKIAASAGLWAFAIGFLLELWYQIWLFQAGKIN